MVTHKFYRAGHNDIEFNLNKETYNLLCDIITNKVPTVGTRQAPLTTSEKIMTISGTFVKDGGTTAEQKAYGLVAMADFGAMINVQIETDIIRSWEGISQSYLFDILRAHTENINFTMKFKVDDYP